MSSLSRLQPEAGEHARRMTAFVQLQRVLASSDVTGEALTQRVPDLVLGVVSATGVVFELLATAMRSSCSRALPKSSASRRSACACRSGAA